MTEEEKEETEEEEEKEKKKKDVFAVDKTQDVISYAKKKVVYKFADRSRQDMYEYLITLIGLINQYQEHIKEKVDKLMADPKTDLLSNELQLSKKDQWKWWLLLEQSAYEVDLHGFYKERGAGLQGIVIEETPTIYNYHIIQGFYDLLYEKGNINVTIGAMRSGKSNMNLNFSLGSIQLGYYVLATNIGIKKEYKHHWINKCAWMTELLRILCHNKIKNIKHIENDTPLKRMTVNIQLDEGEAIMSSQSRSDDKASGEFLKFSQFCRKLDSSLNFIYHDMENFPRSMRRSSNINAILYKGMNKEGEKLENEQEEVVIDLPSRNYTMHINNIPECKLLDTDEWSSFDIVSDDEPDKSVNMNDLFRITKKASSDKVPHAILRYLDNLSFENQPFETVLDMVKKIEEQIRESYMPHIEKPKEYETVLKREMEIHYALADVSKIRFSEKAIKKVAQEEFDIFQVEQRKKEIDPAEIDYEKCDFDLLVTFITKNKPARIKKLVEEDYREINNTEIMKLLDLSRTNDKITKNKLTYLYSWKVRKVDIFKPMKATLLKE